MKSTSVFVTAMAGVLLFSAGAASAQRYYYYGAQPAPYGYSGAEEAMEQRGFYDGVKGADRDFQNRRRPDVNNRDEYRDPDGMPRWAQHEYREGFRRGYYERVRQIYPTPTFEFGPRY